MSRTIVLGMDGSKGSLTAAAWCADMALALDAEVVVVHGVSLQAYPYVWMPPPILDETWHKEMLVTMERDWCTVLDEKKVRFRAEIVEDEPAHAVMTVADREHADMIVVGRRGRGAFTEALLGSVSHRIAHHARQPVVIIPHGQA